MRYALMSIVRSFFIAIFAIAALIGLPGAIQAQDDAPPANCIYVEQDGSFETEGVWRFAETASPGFLDGAVAHSGVQSAFVGIPADAENQNVDSTVWQEMQLPVAGRIDATVWMRSQAGDGNDNRYIVVWDLASDESTVLLYEQVPDEDWREASVDLTPFAGKDILLVLGVHNDGADQKAGMWVDDVHVTACDLLTATPAGVDTPAVEPLPAATATPSPTPTPAPTSTPTPRATPTATPTATRRPTRTPTATASPSPTATPGPVITPRRPNAGGLPDNSALPLLAGAFLSGLVALVVVVINLRR